MTRLPGHVDLDQADPQSWLTKNAEFAVELHCDLLPVNLLWWVTVGDHARTHDRYSRPPTPASLAPPPCRRRQEN